ncbi:MAG: PASTA domain-containing protein [bacterium]
MSETKIGTIILRVLTLLSILLLIAIGCIALFIFIPSSSYKKTVIVPDVREKNLVSATNILCKYKLRVSKTFEIHSLPKNYVISQYPSPGTTVKIGRRVELKVSSGKARVIVPNLQNIHIAEAKHTLHRLSNHTLHMGRLAYIYSSVEKDYVIAQSPLPKAKVPEDSEVNLLISQGNRPVSFYMPELIGMKLEEATNIIKKIGLRINSIQEEICDEPEPGTIINQKPLRGYRVTAGDGLTLIVANNMIDSPIFKEDTQDNINVQSKKHTISD